MKSVVLDYTIIHRNLCVKKAVCLFYKKQADAFDDIETMLFYKWEKFPDNRQRFSFSLETIYKTYNHKYKAYNSYNPCNNLSDNRNKSYDTAEDSGNYTEYKEDQILLSSISDGSYWSV